MFHVEHFCAVLHSGLGASAFARATADKRARLALGSALKSRAKEGLLKMNCLDGRCVKRATPVARICAFEFQAHLVDRGSLRGWLDRGFAKRRASRCIA